MKPLIQIALNIGSQSYRRFAFYESIDESIDITWADMSLAKETSCPLI